MELESYGHIRTEGNYLDTSYTDTEMVVTPAFRLQRGNYYIDAAYVRRGIVKAGLIYDVPRNGRVLVDESEFEINPDKQEIHYRAKLHDDSGIRFKLRLTKDAGAGDYIQLMVDIRQEIRQSAFSYV